MNPTADNTTITPMINPGTMPETPTSHANFFERLLPTAGGIVGGILGSPLGLLGGAGGAAAGGALGQKLENKLTGEDQSTKTAGIENALGMGVGGILGKGISLLGGKVLAPLAEKGVTQLVGGQAKGQLDKDIAQYLTDHSFTDIHKAGQMADVLTGSAGGVNENVDGRAILNKFVENTLANSGPEKIDITDLTMPKLSPRTSRIGEMTAESNGNLLQKAITNNSLSDTPQAQAIRSKVNAITNGLSQDAEGATGALDALNFQRQVAKLAQGHYQDYIDSGRQNSTALNMFKTYNELSQSLKEKLGMGKITVSEEDKHALADDVLRYGTGINKEGAQKLSDTIRNSKDLSVADVRGLEQNWVTVNGALQKIADAAKKNFGSSTTDLAKATLPLAGAVAGVGGKKSVLGTIGGLATASPSADAKMAAILDATARGSKGKLVQSVLPLATRATTIAAANLPNIADSGQSNVQSGVPMNPINAPQGNVPTQSPLEELFATLLAQEQQAPAALGSSLAPVLQTLAPQVQKQEFLTPGIESALSTFANAGGAQGGGGGLLSRLSGLIPGTAAHTYNSVSASAAAQLAALLGISPEEAQGMLPQLMQSQGTAAPQVGGLQSILGSLGQPSAIPAL